MSIDRKEFKRIVTLMREEKVPLSLPNIMVRTELPRETVLQWLEEVDQDLPETPKRSFRSRIDETAAEMRQDLAQIELPKLPTHKRSWQAAALLGFIGGPLGLFYAAPLALAASTSAIYVSALAVLHYLPFVGPAILGYVVPLVHIGCAGVNAYYAFFRKKSV